MERKPIIEIRSLSKTFRGKNAEVHALQDINLKIEQGDIFGIIGMSGAGKSTLVRCMNMLEIPTEGTVLFDGMDLSKLNRKQLREARRSMGMIFQHQPADAPTAEANICFLKSPGGQGDRQKRAKELWNSSVVDKAKSYPSQLRRAKAVYCNRPRWPPISSSVTKRRPPNPNTTSSILALLKDINRRLGITIVIITHEMRVIEEICNRVAIISESKSAECGDVTEIFSHPKTPAAQHLVFPEGKHTTETLLANTPSALSSTGVPLLNP
ncbi:MAG: methionine ABC transporter ATP-binding protein [Anaeromassilibacillus sp.]